MAFMQPQVVHDTWVVIETEHGEEYLPFGLIIDGDHEINEIAQLIEENDEVPADLFEGGMCLEGEFISAIETRTCWAARLSAPGYLDCTDWTLHNTKQEAEDYLKDQYDPFK